LYRFVGKLNECVIKLVLHLGTFLSPVGVLGRPADPLFKENDDAGAETPKIITILDDIIDCTIFSRSFYVVVFTFNKRQFKNE